MLYHGGAPLSAGGFLGVNMFFVLSGFLITSLLLSEWTRRLTIRLGQFWVRRARRLLPALLLLLVAVAAYARLRGRSRRVRVPPARHSRHALLRGQLALHHRWVELLHPVRPALAAVPPVVALDRGAVLHRLAPGRPRAAPPRPPAAPLPPAVARAGGRGGWRSGLGRGHAVGVPAPRLGDSAVRGNRYPQPGHPGRRRAGHRPHHVGPPPPGPAPAGPGPGRLRAGSYPPVGRYGGLRRRPGPSP